MKRVWSGLLLGIGVLPAVAATCEHSSRQGDVQGKFDASGEVIATLNMATISSRFTACRQRMIDAVVKHAAEFHASSTLQQVRLAGNNQVTIQHGFP